jgi:hypothetical protein
MILLLRGNREIKEKIAGLSRPVKPVAEPRSWGEAGPRGSPALKKANSGGKEASGYPGQGALRAELIYI